MIIIIWVYRQTNGKNIASTFIKNVNRYGNILIKKHLNNNNKTEFVKYANLKMLKNLNTGRRKKKPTYKTDGRTAFKCFNKSIRTDNIKTNSANSTPNR